MISELNIILRVLLAASLGALVGLERERQHQPAGLRTHIILVAGSALAMTMSINLTRYFDPNTTNGDPGHLAAQVISGIGFLGAGAIMRFGPNVRGLTTATSLWTMAIVGLAVGMGYFIPAAVITVLLLLVLAVVNIIEERYIHPYIELSLELKAADRPGLVEEIKKEVSEHGKKIMSFNLKKNLEENKIEIVLVIRTTDAKAIDKLVSQISAIQGIKSFEIS